MARRNISIPDELDDRARAAGLNASALTRRAILEASGADAIVVADADREAALDHVTIVTGDRATSKRSPVFAEHLDRLSTRDV